MLPPELQAPEKLPASTRNLILPPLKREETRLSFPPPLFSANLSVWLERDVTFSPYVEPSPPLKFARFRPCGISLPCSP